MKGLRVLHLSLDPVEWVRGGHVRGMHEFNDQEQDFIFEAVRELVEKKPDVVTLEFPVSWVRLLRNVQTRWRKSFGLLEDGQWEKLRCKEGHNEYLLNNIPA